MAGRAQAANLTGMLSQIAETVGEMGKASDWTHENIRTLAAPDIKDGSFESLTEYADWAQRNGKQEVADRYRALALAQQQKSKKGAYAQGLSQRTEQIRNLSQGIGALKSTIAGMPETTTTMVDAPAPKPDVGGPRRPFQAADNGGFRRPPVTPEAREQIAQEQANPNIAILNRRLNDMQGELTNRYTALNKYGEENLQFGGLGTEGSELERTLGAEALSASDAALQRRRNELAIARETDTTLTQLGEEEFKAEQTGYINLYDEQFTRVKLAEDAVRDAPNEEVADERRERLAQEQLALENLEAKWQKWGDDSKNKGAYDARGYAAKSEERYQKAQSDALELKKKQLNVNAAALAGRQTNADITAIATAADMASKGIFELTPKELGTTNPMMVPKLQSELTRHRENHERLMTAEANGTVMPDVLAYAEGLDGANAAISAALTAYQGVNADNTMTSNQEVRERAAKRLTELTNTHRDTASTNQEAVAKSASVASYTSMWREFSTDRAFTDDLMDDITNENVGEFNSYVETFMALDGASVIKDSESYSRYAVMARDAMGLPTDTTNLGEIVDMQDTAQVFSEVVGEVTEAEYERIKLDEPFVSEASARRRAGQVAQKLVGDMQKFLMIDATQQQRQLQNEIDSYNAGDTRFPPRFINLFNGPAGAKTVIKWMKDHPGQPYSYKGFMTPKEEEGKDA